MCCTMSMYLAVKSLSAVEHLYSAHSVGQFRQISVEALQPLFPDSLLVYHEIHNPGQHTDHFCADQRTSLEIRAAWRRHSAESPVVQYYQNGGKDPVIATQDLISSNHLRKSRLYDECWKPFGVTHQIGMRLWSQRSVAGLSIKRSGKYSDKEIAFLRALYPHFYRAWKAALHRECDSGPGSLIVASESSVHVSSSLKCFLSASEIAELKHIYQTDPKAKTEGERTLLLSSGRKVVTSTSQHNDITRSVVLSLTTRPQCPLTKREIEVIQWMSDGKRDNEIAVIMGISHRTVEKHVENILKKLHAENRTSASKQYLQGLLT